MSSSVLRKKVKAKIYRSVYKNFVIYINKICILWNLLFSVYGREHFTSLNKFNERVEQGKMLMDYIVPFKGNSCFIVVFLVKLLTSETYTFYIKPILNASVLHLRFLIEFTILVNSFKFFIN